MRGPKPPARAVAAMAATRGFGAEALVRVFALAGWLGGAMTAGAGGSSAQDRDTIVVVDNFSPPTTVMRLADEPVFAVGAAEGPVGYLFDDINGARRMSDGSVVVIVAGEFEVRKFAPGGQHLWTRGGRGEGRGQFRNFARLLRSCGSGDAAVVYDIYLYRITVFDGEGDINPPYSRAVWKRGDVRRQVL